MVKATRILDQAEAHYEEWKHPQPLKCMRHLTLVVTQSQTGSVLKAVPPAAV